MVSSTICGAPSIKRACPTKCFGYGEVVDVYLQSKRDRATAKRFFKRLLRLHGREPRNIVTDKLRSYGVAHRELTPGATHNTSQYANDRAEQSHAAVSNLFNLGRHQISAVHYRDLREVAFKEWERAVA